MAAVEGSGEISKGVREPSADLLNRDQSGATLNSRASDHPDVGLRSMLAAASAWSAAGWLLGLLVMLPLNIALVRLMTGHDYGVLATAIAVASLMTVASTFGLSSSVATVTATGGFEMASVRRAAVVASSVALLLCGVGIAIVEAFRSAHSSLSVLFVLIPGVLLSPASDASIGVCRGRFRYQFLTMASAIRPLTVLAATALFLVVGQRSALALGAARSVGTVAATGVLVIGSGLLSSWNSRSLRTKQPEHTSAILRLGAAVVVTWIFTIMISQADVFASGAMLGASAAGRYAPVSGLTDAIQGIFFLLGGYMFTAFSRVAGSSDSDEFRRLYTWGRRWGTAMTLPAAAVLEIVPNRVLTLLYGAKVSGMATPARILGIGLIVGVLLGYNGVVLVAIRASGKLVKLACIGIVLTILTCGTLIPLFGIVGAAIATAAPLVVYNALVSASLWRSRRIAPIDVDTGIIFGATFGATLIADAVANALGIVGVAAVVLITGCAVAAATISLMVRAPEDRSLVKEVLHTVSCRVASSRRDNRTRESGASSLEMRAGTMPSTSWFPEPSKNRGCAP